MRQKISFVVGLLLGAALVRLLTRQRRLQRQGVLDPRTEELRRKLAERREQPLEAAPAPPAAPAEPSPPPSAERRPATTRDVGEGQGVTADRRRIYEEGRAAVDEMRRSGEPRPGST